MSFGEASQLKFNAFESLRMWHMSRNMKIWRCKWRTWEISWEMGGGGTTEQRWHCAGSQEPDCIHFFWQAFHLRKENTCGHWGTSLVIHSIHRIPSPLETFREWKDKTKRWVEALRVFDTIWCRMAEQSATVLCEAKPTSANSTDCYYVLLLHRYTMMPTALEAYISH